MRRNKAGIESKVRIETDLGKGLQPVNYWTYIDVRRFSEVMGCGREQYKLGFARYILYGLFSFIRVHVLQDFYAGKQIISEWEMLRQRFKDRFDSAESFEIFWNLTDCVF